MRLPPWLVRVIPSLLAALLYAGFGALWYLSPGLYLVMMQHYISTPPQYFPFSDLWAVLDAASCWRQGADVLVPNACMHGGFYNYSPVLLRISLLGLTPAAQGAGGLLLGALFIAACTVLPAARTRGELALRCAALCSCITVHALECANVDILMFVLCVAGVALLRGQFAVRLAGYALFLLGGALKFYPAVMLVLLLQESRVRVAALGSMLALGAALVVWRYGGELGVIIGGLPLGLPFRGSFGAINLAFGVVLLAYMARPSVLPDGAVFEAALHHPMLGLYVILLTKFLAVAGLLAGVRLAPRYQAGLARLDAARLNYLVAGAVVIAFCFYTAPNYEYRAVFMLLTLPGLYALAAAPGDAAPARPGLLAGLILLLLWERLFWEIIPWLGALLPWRGLVSALGIALWLLREAAWWFVAVRFTALLIAYLRAVWPALRPWSGGALPAAAREPA